MQIGSGFQTSGCRFSSLARNPVQRWLPALALTLLGGFGAATDVRAQAPPAGSASEPTATAQPAATSVTPGVRPTIRLEGNHIVFSSTSEAARTALETVKKKGWKPGPDVVQALSHAPPEPIFLAVGDPRETVPSLLASLPGTLQAQINSAIALSSGGAPGTRPGQPGAGPGAGFGPGGMAAGPGPGGGMSFSMPSMAGRPGSPGMAGSPSMSQPGMSQPGMSQPGMSQPGMSQPGM